MAEQPRRRDAPLVIEAEAFGDRPSARGRGRGLPANRCRAAGGPTTNRRRPVRGSARSHGTAARAGTDPARAAPSGRGCCSITRCSTGHPRFFGYITAPPGADRSPRRLPRRRRSTRTSARGSWGRRRPRSRRRRCVGSRLIGYPAECGGLLVSGGNMANLGLLKGRAPSAPAQGVESMKGGHNGPAGVAPFHYDRMLGSWLRR